MKTDYFKEAIQVQWDKYFFALELMEEKTSLRSNYNLLKNIASYDAQKLDEQYNKDLFYDEPIRFAKCVLDQVQRAEYLHNEIRKAS